MCNRLCMHVCISRHYAYRTTRLGQGIFGIELNWIELSLNILINGGVMCWAGLCKNAYFRSQFHWIEFSLPMRRVYPTEHQKSMSLCQLCWTAEAAWCPYYTVHYTLYTFIPMCNLDYFYCYLLFHTVQHNWIVGVCICVVIPTCARSPHTQCTHTYNAPAHLLCIWISNAYTIFSWRTCSFDSCLHELCASLPFQPNVYCTHRRTYTHAHTLRSLVLVAYISLVFFALQLRIARITCQNSNKGIFIESYKV